MNKIKISAVSYLNSTPFIYGINHSEIKNEIDLSLDIPAVCAQKLISGNVDIGLVPVAVMPELRKSYIITDYCIGAIGKVNSVLLLSNVPINEIKTILLDYQSRTSVKLCQLLCKEYWKVNPGFLSTNENFENDILGNTAAVVIGDRALLLRDKFKYAYDLSQAWYDMTALPFVFACWVANKKIEADFISLFNNALKNGVQHIDNVILEENELALSTEEKRKYLKNNISFDLDADKRKGLDLFFKYQAANHYFLNT